MLDTLGSTDRPEFRADLRADLNTAIESTIEPWIEQLPRSPLRLNKYQLSLLHGCEARFLAMETEPFEWSIATARGTVTHKAIELLISWQGDATPLDYVHGAIDRLISADATIADWLVGLNDADRADLVSRVNDVVATFIQSFPPLSRRWVPVSESRLQARFAQGQLLLNGVIDLSLGRARGHEAGKVIIDLKTGSPQSGHREDLRFYALIELIKYGVPPRLTASFYLDSAQAVTEAVTEDVLWVTARRVTDGVQRFVEITTGRREPSRVPSMACRWCPISDACEPGQAFLAELD